MAHPSAAPARGEAEAGDSPSAGYLLVPRQLRQDCRQVGINTLKLVLFIADATLGWEFSRWAALTYRVIVAEAGIPTDAGVRRATLEALASSLIEVQPTAAGTLYAIHRRYWLLARIQPKWHLYKRVPYDAQADPLDERQAALTRIAQPVETAASANDAAIIMIASDYHQKSDLLSPGEQATITMIAQPEETGASTNGSALTTIASDYHYDSSLLSPGEQPAITMIAQPLAEGAPGLAPHDAKEIKKEERKERRKEGVENGSEPLASHDVDALAQRLADQQVLQQLLAEQETLQRVRPSQAGWGAAQWRLRVLAREIARLQALIAPQATEPGHADPAVLPGEVEPAEERRSPPRERPMRLLRDQAAPAEGATTQDTRRQRLRALQNELARLKRTPSMRLLARQRIPPLEAEMKQLIAEMQESA